MRNEKGASAVSACLSSAVVSTVNQAEVQAKLVSAGLNEQEAWWHIAEIGCASVPFDEELARIAGGIVPVTRPYGLSLGILSNDGLRALELASRIPTGAIHINDQTVGDEAVIPFGGTGNSGNGSRMGGLANLDAYTETQWVTAQSELPVYPF